MIKSISILLTVITVLTGCQSIYQNEEKSPFAPREYYRSIDRVKPIGAAIFNEVEVRNAVETLKDKIKNEPSVKDVIVLTHNGQAVVALKPYAYQRNNVDPLLYSKWFKEEGIAAVLLTEPAQYRKAKRIKDVEEVSREEWETEWGHYFSAE
ncbi:hypothetical protein ABFG93_18595 [Pseudalkalibacillus hwajinpoensis]|uniref:hypothetical protein n=1 Tax=Guptibacillus hwajinpoensis TaxID=208199 RepID=UPI00325AE111